MKSLVSYLLPFLIALTLPSSSPGQSKIVGGSNVDPGIYPWMAAIAKTSGTTLFNGQYCGGTLIAPDWVLTAAHCLKGENAAELQVLVNFTNLDDSSGAEIRGVKGYYIHPAFADIDGDLYNDIGLILLDSPINTVTPIAFSMNPNAVAAGDEVRAIGWGETKGTPNFPAILQMADLTIASIEFAKQVYGIANLDQRHLAAIASGKDTCGGDSGGPLFDADGAPGATPLQVGITSYGGGCARNGVPGIYTNVGTFADWINAFLAQPTTVPPVVTITGKGRLIRSGAKSASTSTGTNFGKRVRPRRTLIRQYEISNAAGTYPLSIYAAQTSSRFFSVTSAPPYLFGGTGGMISLRYRAPALSRNGSSKTFLKIMSNASNAAYYSFRLVGRYRKK